MWHGQLHDDRDRDERVSTCVEVVTIPPCDVCARRGFVKDARYDARLDFGPWANVCEEHFIAYECSLGTGRGQELKLRA